MGPNGPEPVQVPNKPGNLFRSILAGAILGAGAGTSGEGTMSGGGWGAAGRAAGAVGQNLQLQQQQRAAQAQKQFENQQKVDEANQKKIMDQAQIAVWHTQLALEQHKSDMLDQEAIDRKNESSRVLYNTYVSAGGKPPTDPNVPATIDAYDLSKKYVETKGKIAQAPDGMHRVFFDTTNGGEATRDPITGTWSENGKPVDMTTKTTFRVLDVPEDTMNTRTAHTGKEVNVALGYKQFPKEDATVMISPNEMTGLVTKRRQLDEKRNENSRAQEAEVAQEYRAAYDLYKATEDSLKGKLDELKTSPNPNQKALDALQTQQDQNVAEFRASRDKLYPRLKGTPIITSPPPPPPPPSKTDAVITKHVSSLQGMKSPDSSTLFKGLSTKMADGSLPLSQAISLVGSAAIPPEDRGPLISELKNTWSELSPLIKANQQALQDSQATVKREEGIAYEQENPSTVINTQTPQPMVP
jgi:hypothetical protein